MKRHYAVVIGLLLSLMSVYGGGVSLAGESLSGEEIVRRYHGAFFYAGKDLKANVTMRLVDKAGKERTRSLTMLRINAKEGPGQKYYMYFHSPADVRGTAFLVWKHPEKDDDRWLFIPAIKLSTRIAAKDNQSSFVGSDFSYEDISGRDLTADKYKPLKEDALDGRNCYVVESIPKEPSAFSRKVSWIEKSSYLPLKEEYYDVQGDLFKVFTADETKKVGNHLTITRRTMRNVKTGHYTEVVFEAVEYDVGLEDGLFAERTLQRPPQKWIK